MTQEPSETEQLARDYLTIWNERAYADIPAVVSPTFVMYDPTAPADPVPGPKGEVHGPGGLETFMQGVVAGFPDFRVTVGALLAAEDVAMYDGRLTMTHEGPFFGIPPTGRRAEVRYMGLVRVADGEVVEHRVYPPMLDIAAQLGFSFPAVLGTLPRLAWGKLKLLVSQR